MKAHIFLAAIVSFPVLAQEPPSPLLFVAREQIQPGKLAAVTRIEEDAAAFCAKAKCPNPYLAISSITGPSEIWWINGFDSPDHMEKVWRDYAANAAISQQLNTVAEQKGDLVFPAQNMIARFREDLSFATSLTIATARFLYIAVVQVQPGHQDSFEKLRSAVRGTLQRSGRPQWVYQVTSGAADTTFIVISPGRTMQDVHTFSIADERVGAVAEFMRSAIAASESRLYAVSPSMSMPAQSWIDADPDFWRRP